MTLRFQSVNGCIYLCLSVVFGAVSVSAQPYAYLANRGNNTVTFVNVGTGTVSASITVPSGPSGIAVTPNGTTAYVASSTGNSVSPINLSTKAVGTAIPVGTAPGAVAVSPNGALVYVVDVNSAQVTAISTASNSVVATIGVGLHPTSVVFSPDSSHAYVTGMYANNLSVINTSTNSVTSFATGAAPTAVAVTPDGTHLFVTCQGINSVNEYDTAGNLVKSIAGFVAPMSIAITPNGAKAFVANANGASVSVINLSTNTVEATTTVGTSPASVAISTDGTEAYVANGFTSSLSVLSTSSDAVVLTVAREGVYPSAVATVPPTGNPGPPPPPPTCTYSVTPPVSTTLPSTGGTLSFTVTTGTGCSWSASGPGWAGSFWNPGSGTGSGTATLDAGSNGAASALNGSVTITGTNYSSNFNVSENGIAFTGVRVNCGGASFTDPNGHLWQADTGHDTSQTTASIAGADIQAVYQKEAFSPSGLSYTLAVPVGTFTVKLRFAEIYLTEIGQRVMDIKINNATVLSNFDILNSGVGVNTALDKTFTNVSSNGSITIQVNPANAGSVAKLSGIEIY